MSSGQRKDFGDLKGLHQGSEIHLKSVLCSRLQGCLGQVLYVFGLGSVGNNENVPVLLEKNVVNGYFFLSQVVLSFSFASGKMSGVGVSSSWWKLDGNTACSRE